MPYGQLKKNRPIATLIKWYEDKDSGKVTESRKEIQTRFDYLDWKDQKRILLSFLKAGKSDRAWAYSKIYRLWDDSFLEPMKSLWEQHHEDLCAWSVIDHFPINYVIEHTKELEEINGYYHICKRLAEIPEYFIDKTKLQGKEYLLVMLHTHREVSEEEARDIFYEYAHNFCMTVPEYISCVNHKSRGGAFSVEDIDTLNSILWQFHLLGLEKLRESILIWNQDVMSAIYKSEELELLNKESVSDEEYNLRRLIIGLKYLYLALDDKYKEPDDKPHIDYLFDRCKKQSVKENMEKTYKPAPVEIVGEQREKAIAVLEKMKAENPAVAKLVNSMGLGAEIDTFAEDLPF